MEVLVNLIPTVTSRGPYSIELLRCSDGDDSGSREKRKTRPQAAFCLNVGGEGVSMRSCYIGLLALRGFVHVLNMAAIYILACLTTKSYIYMFYI